MYIHWLRKILWESSNRSPFSSFCWVSLILITLLKFIDALDKPMIFLLLLFVSGSLILPVQNSHCLFLQCLLVSHLTVCRLSALIWLGSYNHCSVGCSLWWTKFDHHSSYCVECFFHSYWYTSRLSLAEILVFLYCLKTDLWPHCHLSSPKLQTGFRF